MKTDSRKPIIVTAGCAFFESALAEMGIDIDMFDIKHVSELSEAELSEYNRLYNQPVHPIVAELSKFTQLEPLYFKAPLTRRERRKEQRSKK